MGWSVSAQHLFDRPLAPSVTGPTTAGDAPAAAFEPSAGAAGEKVVAVEALILGSLKNIIGNYSTSVYSNGGNHRGTEDLKKL